MSGIVRTYGEPPTLTRSGKVSRAGHVIQAASGFVIGSGGEGSARVTGRPSSVEAARRRRNRSSATPLPSLYPELVPTYKLELGHKVADTIRSDIHWTQEHLGDQETGGWLLASARNPDYILMATVPGSDSSATRSSIDLGFEQVEAAKRLHRDFAVIGCHHYHPSGGDVPSDRDLRAFARGAMAAGGRWVSLISTPSRTWRPEPEIAAWVTFQPGSPGVLITERLRLMT